MLRSSTLLFAVLMGMSFSLYGQSQVRFYTSMGNFEVKLYDSKTPITVDSFLARVEEGFYDGLTFHRIIQHFVIQGGDPQGDGSGGPGYTLPDEIVPELKNLRGTLGMAHAGPNTAGSQFYINLANNAHLDGDYTVFGEVTQGMNIVDQIAAVPVSGSVPVQPVYMDSLRILQTTGLAAIPAPPSFVVYPNPGTGLFMVKSSGLPALWRLISLQGQVLRCGEWEGGNRHPELNFQGIGAGVYMLEWQEKGFRQVLRLQIHE